MIKVFIKRFVKAENCQTMMRYLLDLRATALHQPGYVMGETLARGENPVELLTIGTWISEEHWKAWETSPERLELENMVESLMEGDIQTAVYSIPEEMG
jgi:antibiotic biosynthesis monooxygenase (ABM) superfamily enzyme